ncbi:PREDICTED: uncharacterized protein LOC108360829 [Rhagoletis zephyria]|uniref:uncharacterized protein LOC108360829 n=1 Tax=Rhagoletis zephyria TaxID=28612 RepID=UPI0008119028|nr:PREDICTED: uncharacterized protein LOC108360829 [Rhagoletis zephyria]
MDNERLDLISQFLQNDEELMSGNAGVLAMLNSLPSSSSSESSSSSDESEREERSKCGNFCEVIEGYNESEFKAHMRLRRSTVEFLIEKYASSAEPRMNYGGRESVPPKKKVFIYIWYIRCGDVGGDGDTAGCGDIGCGRSSVYGDVAARWDVVGC